MKGSFTHKVVILLFKDRYEVKSCTVYQFHIKYYFNQVL